MAARYGRELTPAELAVVKGGAARYLSADEIARRLGVPTSQFHRVIKKQILSDLAGPLTKRGIGNPDIGIDAYGNIVLRDVKTGTELVTDVPLESYGD